jgi:hypothetical protein
MNQQSLSDSKAQVGTVYSRRGRSESQSKRAKAKVVMSLGSAARIEDFGSKEAFNRAYRWMTRLEEGNSSADLRTIFFAERRGSRLWYPPRESIVEGFQPQYSRYGDDSEFVEELQRLEDEEKENIGPWSLFLPFSKDGPAKVGAVYSDKQPTSAFSPKAWIRTLERLQSMITLNSIELLSQDEAVRGEFGGGSNDTLAGMDTSTNSGHPFAIAPWYPSEGVEFKRLPEVKRAYDYYTQRVQDEVVSLNERNAELRTLVAYAGQRLVMKGPKPFQPKSKRLVIAFPKDEAIRNKMFTPPVMDEIRKWKLSGGVLIMCGWFDAKTVDENMQLFLEVAETAGRTVLSGDVSNYDASLPPKIIQDVGYVLAKWVKGHQLLVQNLVDTMIYKTALLTPTKLWLPQPSSLKSGSGLTNLLGSLCNIAIQIYGEEVGLYKLVNLSVLGDDFLLDGPGVSPEATAECFKHFGMESHPEKQFYKRNMLHYLKRLHFRGRPGGVASVMRTLGSALGFETLQYRPDEWNANAYAIRALSQLQNCVFNPGFLDLVDYLKQGDRLLHLGANMSPRELVSGGGKAGEKMLAADMIATWKHHSKDSSFSNWLVNGALRGEVPPPPGDALFKRVYGGGEDTAISFN